MTLPVPHLDDLTWPELVGESRDLVPSTAPSWTDHNIHDPGITVLELLAWLTEQTCFRLDQIPLRHRAAFVSLLGTTLPDPATEADVDDALAAAGRALAAHEELVRLAEAHDVDSLDDLDRRLVEPTAVPARAVTALDLERLALATPGVVVARARAFPGLDLAVPCWHAPGTVSLVVITPEPADRPGADAEVLGAVRDHLAGRRTVGTRLRVEAPRYLPVSVGVGVRVAARADATRVVAAVDRAVRRFLHPLLGGPLGRGWPFGRDVYRTEVLAVAGDVPGVELAAWVRLSGADASPGDAASCANLCVPAVDLVDLVNLTVEVVP